MGTLQLLPDNILRGKVCHECFQYLSVPPVSLNNNGEIVCGRCFDNLNELDDGEGEKDKEHTKSTYNVIAKRFLFKCTNHFNGCSKILGFHETKEHEETCCYEKQECFFCSFSGNLSQILNHSLKIHPEKVSFDGKFSFWLGNQTFNKRFLFLKDDNIFLVTVDVVDELFAATILPAAKTLSTTINQYGVKFFKHDDPLNFDYIRTDYGLLDVNLVNCYEKNVGELVTFFAPGINLCCQILLGQFSIDEKEVELQQRFAKLRQSEVELNNFKQKVVARERNLSQQSEAYDTAMKVIKNMSYNLFKCCSCQKITLKDTYYCLKMHCHCENCLTSMCKICSMPQQFKKLEDVDHLIVPCDWPRCNIKLQLKDYFEHKSSCSERPYKCPLQECQEVVYSSENFFEHWHSAVPSLVMADSIKCQEYGMKEYYWLLHNDLYRVLINFTETNIIQVLIEEVSVLPNNNTFKCHGIVLINKLPFSQIFPSSLLCGKYYVNVNNCIAVPNRGSHRATQIEITLG